MPRRIVAPFPQFDIPRELWYTCAT
jgi:hypothetical protein